MDISPDDNVCNTTHEAMATKVRELGPAIFERVVARKRREDLKSLDSMYLIYIPTKNVDRREVLELRDVYVALSDGQCSFEERRVLEYLRENFRRVGVLIGALTTIGPRVVTSSPYYAISANDLRLYFGEDRNPNRNTPVNRGMADALVVALACGVFGIALSMGLMYSVPAISHGFVGIVLTIVFTLGGANLGFRLMRCRS